MNWFLRNCYDVIISKFNSDVFIIHVLSFISYLETEHETNYWRYKNKKQVFIT